MAERDTFRAIRFVQGIGAGQGQTMFLFAAPAKWLIDRTKIDRWDPNKPERDWRQQGYQRELLESHIKGIGRYLRGTLKRSGPTGALPVFPTSVLLSVRSDVTFAANSGGEGGTPWVTEGQLSLPHDLDIWIIDGQHRIFGLKTFVETGTPDADKFLQYHLPVTRSVLAHCTDYFRLLSQPTRTPRVFGRYSREWIRFSLIPSTGVSAAKQPSTAVKVGTRSTRT